MLTRAYLDDGKSDPSGGNNSISNLLNSDTGVCRLHMGMIVQAPEAHPSADTIWPFDVEQAMTENVYDDKANLQDRTDTWPTFPTSDSQSTNWIPATPDPTDQWKAVGTAWTKQVDTDVQSLVDTWGALLSWSKGEVVAAKPTTLIDDIGTRYLEAPLMCVATAA